MKVERSVNLYGASIKLVAELDKSTGPGQLLYLLAQGSRDHMTKVMEYMHQKKSEISANFF
jgi:hypothetical protein|tara:strand:- start:172 stop:354 length:183 start_codon:yes stop_codon:yes gene_type:complete